MVFAKYADLPVRAHILKGTFSYVAAQYTSGMTKF